MGAGIRPSYSADEVAAEGVAMIDGSLMQEMLGLSGSDTVIEAAFDQLRSMILAEDRPVIEQTIV
ncbi:MAG: hypothetical protein DYH08_12735 [Actinobacteria bacterium ATB1]|nr:hypothetical protein [Actinobacteria bacterium ATB1]